VQREDSGVIDLHAIHKKAEAEREAERVAADIRARDPLSSPPPAFTMALPEDEEMAEELRPKSRKVPVFIGMGVAALVAIVGIAALSGRGEPKMQTVAVAAREPAPPPPAAAPAPPPPPGPATPTPAPPSTGVGKSSGPPVTASVGSKRGGSGKRPFTVGKGHAGGGVKMQKVQSSGT
jgi:hypothetical protein